MKTDNTKQAKEWWRKSERDMAAALILAKNAPPIFDYAIFHCQQAAEKAIKSFLVYHGESFEKVHSLYELIELAAKFDEHINSRIGERHTLSKLAVETRYPGYGLGSGEGFTQAMQNAESFCDYIKTILPGDITTA